MEDIKDMKDTVEENEDQTSESIDAGEIELMVPIRAGGKDVTILKFDFALLSNDDLIRALKSDPKNNNPFDVNAQQLKYLFSIAAAKATDGIDEYDIRERMSAFDEIAALQVAKLFFATKARGAKIRFAKG